MGIEVGEYVRLKDCLNRESIARITKILEKDACYKNMQIYKIDTYFKYCGCSKSVKEVYKEDIIKHSKNIIDLIEIGDYVNKHEVLQKYSNELRLNTGNDILCFCKNKEIETILTKEQYENNCYKIGE